VLGYGTATDVDSRIPGTLTSLQPAGTQVMLGHELFRVDDTPIVLLYGSLPAYRDLAVGETGADVLQFEQNLKALGYKGFTVDDRYTAGTARAVSAWQKALGLPRTGVVELGRVFYASDSVRVATTAAVVGDEIQPGKVVLDVTGFTRSVVVNLALSDRRFASVGAAVTLTLPDGTSTKGKVTATSTVLVAGTGQDAGTSTTKLAVTVVADDKSALTAFDSATVDVGFTAPESGTPLTVPVDALLALAEGGYGLQLVDGKHTRIVAVNVGTFAGGRVEVSGGGIAAGDIVGISE
jgi:peptidoglycan hydrolase-like protein with peptidoglycan-binding domain